MREGGWENDNHGKARSVSAEASFIQQSAEALRQELGLRISRDSLGKQREREFEAVVLVARCEIHA